MELEIGMYVRTKNGKIWPIISQYAISGHRKDIVKSSYNILDLLEVGDFIYTDYGWGWHHHKVDENTIVIDDGDEFIDVKKDEIHRILTQEMLWDNSYEVGD